MFTTSTDEPTATSRPDTADDAVECQPLVGHDADASVREDLAFAP
jgi:hypothetical protein